MDLALALCNRLPPPAFAIHAKTTYCVGHVAMQSARKERLPRADRHSGWWRIFEISRLVYIPLPCYHQASCSFAEQDGLGLVVYLELIVVSMGQFFFGFGFEDP